MNLIIEALNAVPIEWLQEKYIELAEKNIWYHLDNEVRDVILTRLERFDDRAEYSRSLNPKIPIGGIK